MKKIRPEKANNEVVERIETLINNILHRKTYWVDLIIRRTCLLYDATEGHMTEGKRVRSNEIFDDLKNRRKYLELKEEAEA